MPDKTISHQKVIAIIEGNHEGLVPLKGGRHYGAAEGFAACLQALDASVLCRIIRPHFSDHIYHDGLFDGCDGAVFTGSGNAWSADDDDAAPARKVMGCALDSQLPVFGSCYGLQLAVAVLGGANQSNPIATEFAIARDIIINDAGQRHALYQGKSHKFDARCMHRDEIARLPDGAISLSKNGHSAHQAMVYEQGGICFWGVQYHPELRFDDIAHYIETSDVDSFADAKAFSEKLGITADITEIADDFRRYEISKDERLVKKYHLSASLTDDNHHRCEIANFLKMVSCPSSG